MQVNTGPNRPFETRKAPSVAETLVVFVGTTLLVMLVGQWGRPIFSGGSHGFYPFVTHLPLMIIPWVWYHLRVKPSLPVGSQPLWRWTKGSGRSLLLIASWLVTLNFLGDLLSEWGHPLPEWYQQGASGILPQLLFQGVFVGLSEEMMMRPALHLPLSMRLAGSVVVFRKWRISYAVLVTAFCFGLFHLGNIFTQSLGDTIAQMGITFLLAIIFGVYYDRTRNYLGTALLHNLYDVCGVVVVLLVGMWM
jgi:membrane protease YdiL (CAAX protease family)